MYASITLVLSLVAAPVLLAEPCMISGGRLARSGNTQHWSSNDSDDGNVRTTVRWSRGDCELRVDARGKFTVKSDLSGIATVDDGGYIDFEERDGDVSRKVRISNGAAGLEYRWTLNGANGFDVNGERWLADILLAVERRTAMFAKTRVPELLKKGQDAVLDEADRLDADYARRVYYMALLKATTVTDAGLERILKQAADNMASDYERSEIVRAIAAQGRLSDRVTRSIITVAQRMSSDYEKRRALSAAIEGVAGLEARNALFSAAATMSSSYELAELLIAAQKRSLVDSASNEAYFKAVSRLSSDYEHRRTLSSLLKQRGEPPAPAVIAGVLRSSTSIHSDYELASLLIEIAHTTAIRGELRDLYLKAVRSIQSDYEYRRALQALLEQDKRT